MDGVFVDFTGGVLRHFKIPPITLDALPKPLNYWWMLEITKLSEKEFWTQIDFPEFWEKLEWTLDGKRIIEWVERRLGFDKICILTNPSNEDSAIIGKRRWLRKHLPSYFIADKVLMGSQKQFCSGNERKILIDDSDSNIIAFEKHGGIGLTVPRPWNKKYYESNNALNHLMTELR